MSLVPANKSTIRASSLTGFTDLVRRLDGDPDELLSRFDIEPNELQNPDNVLSSEAVAGVVEEAARQLDCPDFGLRLAEHQDLMVLGQLAILALNAQDIGSALDSISQHITYYAFGFKVDLQRDYEPGKSRLTLGLKPSSTNPRHLFELTLGVANNALRMLSNDTFQADVVLLKTDSPLSQQRYWRAFQAPVLLNQETNALVFDRRYIERKIDRSNPQQRDLIAHHIGDVVGSPPDNPAYRAEIAIRRWLPTQRCSQKNIARKMGMTTEEFVQSLREESVEFEELLDRIRRERADAYLGEMEIPMQQVASLLGFNGNDELAQACRRWFGSAPLERRHQLTKGR